jgi:hypothetical protein
VTVPAATAKEAHSKAVEWHVVKWFADVSISDGINSYWIAEFSSAIAQPYAMLGRGERPVCKWLASANIGIGGYVSGIGTCSALRARPSGRAPDSVNHELIVWQISPLGNAATQSMTSSSHERSGCTDAKFE